MFNQTNSCSNIMTIEKRLELWAECKDSDEVYSTLWHGWSQNKRWLSQLLELTLPSFPTYSRHDESHCKNVLKNIERILGYERIMKLSPTDCFMLLHVAYVHDLSMAITSDQRLEIAKSNAFVNLVMELKNSSDSIISKYANILSERIYEKIDENRLTDRGQIEFLKRTFVHDIEIFQAVIIIFGEFERRRHENNSAEKLRRLINDPEKLGTGFSISGIPMRIFYRIADCAELHTNWNMHDILKLPKEDTGYSLDTMHPRFVAVMLQLGDALDMDNDRFHLFAKDFLGTTTEESQKHFDKHSSIRNLQINENEIYIEADCPTQDALRLIRNECDGLEKILEFSSYHWSEICPPEINGCLPTLQTPKLLLINKEIPHELVDAKFSISQSKAFNLLEGANVYNCHFPFLREVLQNSIDATKIQYWTDIIHERRLDKKSIEILHKDGINKIGNTRQARNYPIRIEFRFRKKDERNRLIEIKEEDFEQKISNNEIGIQMNIIDYGTGISDKDILNISQVGSSFNRKKNLLKHMPEWLFPTGEFGVGLQSVFLVTNQIKAQTHTRKGHCYDIYFSHGSKNGSGYINVEPISTSYDDYRPYGTNFEIFISNKNRLKHRECLEAWNGKDPFSNDFDKMRPLRHASELLNQLLITLDDIIGESLFPIEVYVEKAKIGTHEFKSNLTRTPKYNLYEFLNISRNERVEKFSKFCQLNCNMDNKETLEDFVEYYKKDVFIFDFNKCKLYIWNDECQIFISVSGLNLFNKFIEDSQNCKTKIYYKGIFVENKEFDSLNDIIELIDIKGGLNKTFLQLNRSGFTEKGYDYLNKIVYPKISQSIYTALEHILFSEEFYNKFEKYKKEILDTIGNQNYNKSAFLRDIAKNIYTFLFLFLYYQNLLVEERYNLLIKQKPNHNPDAFYKKLEKFYIDIFKKLETLKCEDEGSYFQDIFDVAINEFTIFSNLLEGINNDSNTSNSALVNMNDDLFNIFNKENKYGVISMRDTKKQTWRHLLVRIKYKKNGKNVDFFDYKSMKSFLEDNCYYLFERVIEIKYSIQYHRNNNFSRWLLKSLPTIGICATEDSNTRLNILSTHENEFVYINSNLVTQTYNRICEIYRNKTVDRFAIMASPDYEYISIPENELLPSIYPVKRGYLSNKNIMMLILPFKASLIVDLIKERTNMVNQYNNFINQIEKILKNNGNVSSSEYNVYHPLLLLTAIDRLEITDEMKKEFRHDLENENQSLEKTKKICNEFDKCICRLIENEINYSRKLDEEKLLNSFFAKSYPNEDAIIKMCLLNNYFNEFTFEVYVKTMKKDSSFFKKAQKLNNYLAMKELNNMIKYIIEKNSFDLRDDDILLFYKKWLLEFKGYLYNSAPLFAESQLLLSYHFKIKKGDN